MQPGIANAVPFKITTPLIAIQWHHALLSSGLLSRFPDVPTGLASGFKTGVSSILLDTFIPNNHKSALENPFAVEAHISKELRLNISELEANTNDLHEKFEQALAHLEEESDEKDNEIAANNAEIQKLGHQVDKFNQKRL